MKRALLIAMAACGGTGDASVDASTTMPDGSIAPGDGTPTAPDAGVLMPDSMAPPGKRVFVSSLRYSADLRSAGGKPTGLASADAICQTLADAVRLGGTFRAWLSTTTVHAIDHITGDGPWYRMDGALAFPNRARLGTTPLVPISIDEQGGTPDPFYEAWTGTALGGYRAPLGSRQSVTCVDWTSTVDSTLIGGVVGDIDANGASWTNLATGYCSPFSRRLYCFEQ
ncbi:MAG: hypothetical protein M3680_18045 [Myxococcota bacterium]|nr:hypothetical protein [Myxococcota bacterium]